MEGGGIYQFHDINKEANEDEEVILIAEEDVAEGLQTCHKSLMGRIFADRSFSTGTMEGAMYAIWGKPKGFRVEDVESKEMQISSFPLWAQLWGLPEQYKAIEVGHKLGSKLGSINDIDFFEVKGKESRIIKVRVEIEGIKKIKDNLKILDPNGKQLEIGLRYERIGIFCTYYTHIGHEARHCQLFLQDSAENNIKQDCIGEWVKANQTSKRIERKEGSIHDWIKNTSGSVAQPKRKLTPSWLLNGFLKMSMKETKEVSNGRSTPIHVQSLPKNSEISKDNDQPCLNHLSLEALKELPNHNNCAVVFTASASSSFGTYKRPRLKQIAKQQSGNKTTVSGQKRRSNGKENSENWKKCVYLKVNSDDAMVEGASREVAPMNP
ncbi:hypothetical protein PIB30_011165 [Stylosanthes scabra]|uniref:DUF4283 domain-containing protein n=1 Tax=Stylosanthes scabra TaxID=79078 RepID=A0ABU6R608_9FABA|nr:hypothetical protein [Stylosanthes scabra]